MRYLRLSAFLAARGLTFGEWLALARNYDQRHWMLYNEFNEQEAQQELTEVSGRLIALNDAA